MRKPKKFDCIAMKRRIQEKQYEETKGMSREEFEQFVRDRIASSRFASFLERPVSGGSRR